MDSLTRRTFLEMSALAAGALVTSQRALASPFAAAEPHIEFPSAPRDRISIASWPFRAFIISPKNEDRDSSVPGMGLKDFAGYVVGKFNVHNIEPYNWHFSSLDPAYLAGFRDAVTKAGAHVVNIAVDGENSFYDPDSGVRQKAIAFAKKWIDAAVAIGSPSIRANDPQSSKSDPDVERAAESLRQVADYAAEKNVVVNLENDNPISEDPFFQVKVVEAVNHPYLHTLPDFGNSLAKGEDFNYRSVEAMFGHAYNICHVKATVNDAKGNPHQVDLERTFKILKASGYRGYCSIEYDQPGDPHEPTAKLVEESVRFLS